MVSRVNSGAPVLLYYWQPSGFVVKNPISRVALRESTDLCYTNNTGSLEVQYSSIFMNSKQPDRLLVHRDWAQSIVTFLHRAFSNCTSRNVFARERRSTVRFIALS